MIDCSLLNGAWVRACANVRTPPYPAILSGKCEWFFNSNECYYTGNGWVKYGFYCMDIDILQNYKCTSHVKRCRCRKTNGCFITQQKANSLLVQAVETFTKLNWTSFFFLFWSPKFCALEYRMPIFIIAAAQLDPTLNRPKRNGSCMTLYKSIKILC